MLKYRRSAIPQKLLSINFVKKLCCICVIIVNTKKSSYDYCYFLKEITDNELTFTSEFPHGYSLNQGRSLYYYGKHIMYSIPTNYPVSILTFNLSTDKMILYILYLVSRRCWSVWRFLFFIRTPGSWLWSIQNLLWVAVNTFE